MPLRRLLTRSRVIALLIGCIVLLATVLIAIIIRSQDSDTRSSPPDAAKQSSSAPEKPDPTDPPAEHLLPGGKRELFPNYRLVALYGTPSSTRLGVLGEQPLEGAIARAKRQAEAYRPHSKEPIYPAFEIIASVASAAPTPDNDYSNELGPETLRAWVDAAKKAGIYVVLDLQPGREDFLTQAKQYESLLKEPHVGLALDPEWRLKPHEIHMEQIGSVGAVEVNAVSKWLAELTVRHRLPQKLFLVHQFRMSMITDRDQLNMSHKSLAYVIQMDGNGTQPVKAETWGVITRNAPKGMYFGWKNFHDEDHPMLNAAQTMLITPKPWYVSYQ
jgi:hypothetical protein